MAYDKELLDSLQPGDGPILHLYEWERPSATYGYFIKPGDFFELNKVEDLGLDIARRPTGGGIVFHLFDLAFSVLIPSDHPAYSKNTLDNYAFVNRGVIAAIKPLIQGRCELLPQDPQPQAPDCQHYCYAKPTIYDVMLEGKKVAGAAQRRKKQGFLHQGSIAIAPPDIALLSQVLKRQGGVMEAMSQTTHTLLPQDFTPDQLSLLRETIKERLITTFQQGLS